MTIIESLARYAPLSEECQKALLERSKPVIIPAGTGLLSPGQISDKIYFIESGTARIYYNAAEEEEDAKFVTSWFAREGGLVSSIDSFFGQLNGFSSDKGGIGTSKIYKFRRDNINGCVKWTSI